MRTRGERPGLEEIGRLRTLGREVLVQRWREDLESPVAGIWTVEGIRPHLERWLKRRHGALSYRLVQVLTGHGCFCCCKYLHGIARREVSPICHECGAPEDTALHTMALCASWAPQRHAMVSHLDGDLSLSSVINLMLGSEEGWSIVASFCEAVMALKEASEREREQAADALPLRRRRTGGRRRRYAHLMPPP
ncbi:uncharacterized protein LOC120630148 [Pararge aegeria]|uniref:uncharacterized protein LOC120630148 n=1 Tax=Pararge aegeria TaxID=116150 RepID=UPI0019D1A00F|nr:uncharacterized protein LOC120630148 [Pararge aegeria]